MDFASFAGSASTPMPSVSMTDEQKAKVHQIMKDFDARDQLSKLTNSETNDAKRYLMACASEGDTVNVVSLHDGDTFCDMLVTTTHKGGQKTIFRAHLSKSCLTDFWPRKSITVILSNTKRQEIYLPDTYVEDFADYFADWVHTFVFRTPAAVPKAWPLDE